jgi:hypothetical protein
MALGGVLPSPIIVGEFKELSPEVLKMIKEELDLEKSLSGKVVEVELAITHKSGSEFYVVYKVFVHRDGTRAMNNGFVARQGFD